LIAGSPLSLSGVFVVGDGAETRLRYVMTPIRLFVTFVYVQVGRAVWILPHEKYPFCQPHGDDYGTGWCTARRLFAFLGRGHPSVSPVRRSMGRLSTRGRGRDYTSEVPVMIVFGWWLISDDGYPKHAPTPALR